MRGFGGPGEMVRRHAEAARVAGLAAAALVLYLFELGKGALVDWDEAIYAEVTKEMVRGHHWLTPYWNHKPFFEKPPLLYWAQMVSFHALGMNEFAARLPSALAGVGVVLLVYAATRRMAGTAAGVFAGLVLLMTRYFYHTVRLGTTDALLCLFIYLTVYGYVRLREGDGRWFYLVCAALGLGILDKGPAALVAPMAIGLDWFFRRRGAKLRQQPAAGTEGRRSRLVTARQFWLGMLLLAVITLPWHIWMVAHFGWKYLNEYLGYQILTRAERGIEGNTGGVLFYFHVLWKGAVPWCLLGIWALVRWVWKREWQYSLPWLLMGVTLGLYTAVQTNLMWYVMPFYPALAMEVGRLLAVWNRRWRVTGFAVVLAAAGLTGYAMWRRVQWPGLRIPNQERQLALVAKDRRDAGPLIVVGMAGADSPLDIRTVLFYSDRNVEWQQLPNQLAKLRAAVKEYPVVDVVVLRKAAKDLEREFAVRVVKTTPNLELARVSRRQ